MEMRSVMRQDLLYMVQRNIHVLTTTKLTRSPRFNMIFLLLYLKLHEASPISYIKLVVCLHNVQISCMTISRTACMIFPIALP